ncbi:MAG: DUF1223 domain-containing protein [Cohaesibacter sp.]|nr:DUF1223 domain-containing protein [Cohaesibacter sp.]
MPSSFAAFALFFGAFAFGSGSVTAKAQSPAPVVVELFTSQGCSSCPPADKLLGEMVGNPNIIALTEAVDYWDYLGWKDENARHEHTVRQQDYARLRGDRRVYTPQMVINGRVHVVGSRRHDVAKALKRFEADIMVPMSLTQKGDVLTLDIGARPQGMAQNYEGNLVLAYYKRAVSADIKRGENRGRKIVYHNVVGDMRTIGMWHGKAMSVELPMSEARTMGYDGYAVLLQADVKGYPGPIYGAAQFELK